MFRMDKNTKSIFDKLAPKPSKRAKAQEKKLKVYQFILENPEPMKNIDLARAAGYKMDRIADMQEYKAGANFIGMLIRNKDISFIPDESDPEKRLFFVQDETNVSPVKTIKTEPIKDRPDISTTSPLSNKEYAHWDFEITAKKVCLEGEGPRVSFAIKDCQTKEFINRLVRILGEF